MLDIFNVVSGGAAAGTAAKVVTVSQASLLGGQFIMQQGKPMLPQAIQLQPGQ